jgi:hypothetical protein
VLGRSPFYWGHHHSTVPSPRNVDWTVVFNISRRVFHGFALD